MGHLHRRGSYYLAAHILRHAVHPDHFYGNESMSTRPPQQRQDANGIGAPHIRTPRPNGRAIRLAQVRAAEGTQAMPVGSSIPRRTESGAGALEP